MKPHHMLCAALAALALPAAAAPETYTVDPAHTYPNFEVNHLGFSTARGMFTDTRGKITLDREARTGKIEIVVNTASLYTGHAKRDEHLKNEDFFDVAKYPTMTFRSDRLRFHKGELNGAEGALTLLGKTLPVTLTLTSFNCGPNPITKKQVCGANAVADIKRSAWGMDAYVPAVGDEVHLEIQIEAIRD